jgi:hypothetical protein
VSGIAFCRLQTVVRFLFARNFRVMMFDEALKSFYEVLVIGEAVCLRNPVELLSYADCNFVVQSFFIDLGFFGFQQV